MSQYDRSPYADGERPLTFEPRGRGGPPRRRGPAPVTLVLSVLVLAGLIGGAGFLLYRDGVRGPLDGPRPVGAPVSDVRTMAPPQPASADEAAGLSVYRDDAATAPPVPTFAPPPETPVGATAPGNVSGNVSGAVSAAAATPPPAPATAAAGPGSGARAGSPAKRDTDTIGDLASAAQASRAPDAISSAASSAESVVQIGAFSSRSLAAAGWDAAAAAAPGAMAGKDRQVVRTQKDGQALYRAAITGFASRGEAQALCAKLRAAGQTCFVR